MSLNDLFVVLTDLEMSYKFDTGILLSKTSFTKMLIRSHKSTHGLGPFVNQVKGNLLYAHNGLNHGYRMHFHCIPGLLAKTIRFCCKQQNLTGHRIHRNSIKNI